MNSAKDSVKTKKGSYTVEAAITLPVFILVFVALALVVNVITDCEKLVFEECRTIHELDRSAPEIIPDPRNSSYKIEDFDYLYSDKGIDDLISLGVTSEHKIEYPFGIFGKIRFRMNVLSRAFTGSLQSSDTLDENDFTEDSGSHVVVIFPKYGERFHSSGCRYVRQDFAGEEVKLEMEQKDAELKGYTPCLICGGG